MELTYAPEDELFRAEIRAWLQENLPKGWFDKGFEMSNDARNKFNEEWPSKLFSGGWICATWPTEYGGKGLSTMQGVVLAEEFANAKAPMRADFFGDTLVGPTLLQWMAMNGSSMVKKFGPHNVTMLISASFSHAQIQMHQSTKVFHTCWCQ